MRKLIYIAIVIRVFTNLIPIDWVYFVGRDLFEIIALYILFKYFSNKIDKDVILLCLGCSFWNLIKPMFTDVSKLDYYEVFGFVIGLIIIFAHNGYKRYSNRHK